MLQQMGVSVEKIIQIKGKIGGNDYKSIIKGVKFVVKMM